MFDTIPFTIHAAERFHERFPKLNFKEAVSDVKRGRTINTRLRKLDKYKKCKTYVSWLGPIFIVKNGVVVTVY